MPTTRLSDTVAKLAPGRVVESRLPTVEPPPGIPSKVGRATVKKEAQKGGSGAGIASPLTEDSYAARTYYAESTIFSSDGIFSVKIRPVHQVSFTDDGGNPAVIAFADPAPAP